MLKTFITLIRGASARAEEDFADRSALLILDQQSAVYASIQGGTAKGLLVPSSGDPSQLSLLFVGVALHATYDYTTLSPLGGPPSDASQAPAPVTADWIAAPPLACDSCSAAVALLIM